MAAAAPDEAPEPATPAAMRAGATAALFAAPELAHAIYYLASAAESLRRGGGKADAEAGVKHLRYAAGHIISAIQKAEGFEGLMAIEDLIHRAMTQNISPDDPISQAIAGMRANDFKKKGRRK